MKIATLIGAGSVLALLAGGAPIAIAQTVTPKCQMEFNVADTNSDGTLSAAERAKIDQMFAELNSNNDGKISKEDFRGCMEGVFQRLKKKQA